MKIGKMPSLLYSNASKHKKTISRRIIIYMIILAIMFPIVFVNRTAIYSTILSRYDSWTHYTNEEGITITDYGYQARAYVGPQISIRLVGQGAINYYAQMKEGNASAGVFFNNTIDYILEHRKTIGIPTENGSVDITVWPYEFAIWDLPNGWQSAMVDAIALHALSLAYQEYGNESYLEIFDQVIRSFEVPVSLGGNLLILEDGTHWYPETVIPNELSADYPVPLVLNGFLFALRHMYLANEILNNTALKHAFDLGAISAAANMYKYDLPQYNWTLYHIAYPQKLASYNYQRIHTNLAAEMFEYTNVTIFDYYSKLWATYTSRPVFTPEEIFSWEFIGNGLLMASFILVPLTSIDILQTVIRHFLKKRSKNEADVTK